MTSEWQWRRGFREIMPGVGLKIGDFVQEKLAGLSVERLGSGIQFLGRGVSGGKKMNIYRIMCH